MPGLTVLESAVKPSACRAQEGRTPQLCQDIPLIFSKIHESTRGHDKARNARHPGNSALVMRQFTEDDVDNLFNLNSDPRERVPWSAWASPALASSGCSRARWRSTPRRGTSWRNAA